MQRRLRDSERGIVKSFTRRRVTNTTSVLRLLIISRCNNLLHGGLCEAGDLHPQSLLTCSHLSVAFLPIALGIRYVE